MRTTVTLAPDVAAAVERLRRDEGLGVSDAINQLVRQGLTSRPERRPYQHVAYPVGVTVDVSNIGEVLDLLDQDDAEERAARRDDRAS